MESHRVYLMTIDDHIRSVDDIEADDDAEAIRLARHLHPDDDLELWCGKRKVASMPRAGVVILSQASALPASSDDLASKAQSY
jgi:hypothetical protein